MQSIPIPFAAIAALALCAIVLTKAQAEGDLFFPDPRATEACEAVSPASERMRRHARSLAPPSPACADPMAPGERTP